MEQTTIELIKDLSPAFIGITALVITIITTWMNNRMQALNLERQLKNQLETTVEKEWRNNVRSYIATIIYHTYYLAPAYVNKEVISPNREAEFLSSVASVHLLLNPDNEIENNVLLEINTLGTMIPKGKNKDDLKETMNQREKIIIAVHKLFESRK